MYELFGVLWKYCEEEIQLLNEIDCDGGRPMFFFFFYNLISISDDQSSCFLGYEKCSRLSYVFELLKTNEKKITY